MNDNTNRPNWDDYFIEIVEVIASRGTCNRGRNGCLIVTYDNQILAAGYVGSPSNAPHCDEIGHLIQTKVLLTGEKFEHCIRTIHAEVNAIAQAAKRGSSLNNAILYTLMEPCYDCAKLIIQCGIKKVVSKNLYHAAEMTRDLFNISNVELIVLERLIRDYE